MNKTKLIIFAVALLLLVPCLVFALPGAHDPSSGKGYACNSCHIAGSAYGHNDATYTYNMCLKCHSTAGTLALANNKFDTTDFADPYKTTNIARGAKPLQTSHKWFGSLTSANAKKARVLAPIDTSAYGLNKASFGPGNGYLFCNRCHNVHGNSGLQSTVKPYLRVQNDIDQMCLNCHRQRNTTDHRQGTHPVNVSYTSARMKAKFGGGTGEFLDTPYQNPANSTAQVKLRKGFVVCSTCHGTHNTDSRSSTFDPFSSNNTFGKLSSSNGTLVRVDAYGKTINDMNICINCHSNKLMHNPSERVSLQKGTPTKFVQCNDCHSAHVDYDAAATGAELIPNNNLVRRYLQYSNASRVNKRVFYRYTGPTTKEYYNANGKGLCQSCHYPPLDHYVGTTPTYASPFPEPGHKNCSSCHSHTAPTGSFSYSVGTDCVSACHGSPPVDAGSTAAGYVKYNETTTPHKTHAAAGTYYNFTCDQCHKGYVMPDSTIQVFKNHTGIFAGPTAAYNSGTSTCSTVYCHSNGAGSYKGTQNAIVWNDSTSGLGSITGLAAATRCATCHDNTTIASGSHAKHVASIGTGMQIGCVSCHAQTVSDNTTLLVSARLEGGNHVNAVKDVDFSGVAPATGATCATIACHGNGKGSNPLVTPVWGSSATGSCNACHMTATSAPSLNTGSHAGHITRIGTGNSSCSSCHLYTNETAATHANGTLNVTTGCTLCHADPYGTASVTPAWGSASAGCVACHNNSGAFSGTGTAPATGGHDKHMALSGALCNQCHAGASAGVSGGSGTTHPNGVVDVTGGYPANVTKHTAGSYTGTCSAASCHVSAYSTAYVPTTVWGSTSAGCKVCHDATTGIFTADGSPATGNHTKHMAAGSLCGQCHNGAIVNANGGVGHMNTKIDVLNGYPANITKHTTAATGTCSTASCHVGPYNATVLPTAVWGSTGSAGCASCHTGTPGAFSGTGTAPATGSHNIHMAIGSSSCGQCHAGAIANSSGGSSHVNGNIDVTGGYPSVVTKHTANTGYTGTCSSTTCHVSSYNTASVTSAVWGNTTAKCATCHNGTPGQFTGDGSPSTGSHGKHMALTGYGVLCGQCHTGAVINSTGGGATHMNTKIDVVNYSIANVTKHTAGTYSGTCATTCHVSAYSTAAVAATTAWGSTGLAACTACHDGAGAFTGTGSGPATGSHNVHMAQVSIACGDCHASAIALVTGGTSHINTKVDVTGGYPTAVTKHTTASGYAGATCNATTCHGSGTASPVWGTDLSAKDSCTKCHNSTGTPSNIGAITVPLQNVYLEAPGLPAGADKGKVSTNLKTGAHQTHLRLFNGFTNYSTMEFRCESCHGPLTGKSVSHANADSKPAFQGLATNRGAMLAVWTPGTFTCSNTYCHNPAAAVGGTLTAGNVGTRPFVSWTSSSYLGDTAKTDTNCNRCHKSPGSGLLAGAYNHSGLTMATPCIGCHGHEGDTQGPVGHRHMDGKKWGTGGSGCTTCHGYPPMSSAELAARAGGEFTQASLSAYAGAGGGHHRIHLSPTITEADTFTPCMPCHDLNDHNTGTVDVNVAADTNYRFDDTRSKRYDRTTNKCSNVSCHFQPTAAW